MAGLAVQLPLSRNSLDGFKLIKDLRTMTKQNLKMLVLTSPGERVMEPGFGIGLKRYIFRAKTPAVSLEIRGKIKEQVQRYMPMISLRNIVINGIEEDNNHIFIEIHYSLPALSVFDILDFNFFLD